MIRFFLFPCIHYLPPVPAIEQIRIRWWWSPRSDFQVSLAKEKKNKNKQKRTKSHKIQGYQASTSLIEEIAWVIIESRVQSVKGKTFFFFFFIIVLISIYTQWEKRFRVIWLQWAYLIVIINYKNVDSSRALMDLIIIIQLVYIYLNSCVMKRILGNVNSTDHSHSV